MGRNQPSQSAVAVRCRERIDSGADWREWQWYVWYMAEEDAAPYFEDRPFIKNGNEEDWRPHLQEPDRERLLGLMRPCLGHAIRVATLRHVRASKAPYTGLWPARFAAWAWLAGDHELADWIIDETPEAAHDSAVGILRAIGKHYGWHSLVAASDLAAVPRPGIAATASGYTLHK